MKRCVAKSVVLFMFALLLPAAGFAEEFERFVAPGVSIKKPLSWEYGYRGGPALYASDGETWDFSLDILLAPAKGDPTFVSVNIYREPTDDTYEDLRETLADETDISFGFETWNGRQWLVKVFPVINYDDQPAITWFAVNIESSHAVMVVAQTPLTGGYPADLIETMLRSTEIKDDIHD